MRNFEQVIEQTQSGRDFYLCLGDFLDEFYRSNSVERQKMIDVPAPSMAGVQAKQLAYAAATAHKLANDFDLEVPQWVYQPQYYLRDAPYFAGDAKGNLRLLFMYSSPSEFKHRNLFVDANVLARV